MPVFDLGYRAWEGERTPPALRWRAIAAMEIRKAWRSTIVRRVLIVTWLPVLYFGGAVFAYEQAASMSRGQMMDHLRHGFLSQFFERHEVQRMTDNPEQLRSIVWTRIAFWFLRGPQSLALIVLLGVVGAPLIAHDVRSRAFVLYFSRPVSRLEYLAGKAGAHATYLAAITLLPGLLLYVTGLALSPGLEVMRETYALPLRVVASSVVMIVPTTLLMLVLSSLTREPRYATFGCYVLWGFGALAYAVIEAAGVKGIWYVLSPWHAQVYAQEYIFGIRELDTKATWSFAALVGVCALSVPLLWRRISAPMRS